MDLPNFAIPEVEVDAFPIADAGAGASKTSTSMYTVQFTDSSNAGKQNTLTCELVSDSTVNGAQPKYASVSLCKVYNVGGPEWFDESGTALELDLSDIRRIDYQDQKSRSFGRRKFSKRGYNLRRFPTCSSKGDCDSATGTCTCN